MRFILSVVICGKKLSWVIYALCIDKFNARYQTITLAQTT